VGLRGQDTHQEALQGIKQSPKYKTLTHREWAFIEKCLAYELEERPTADKLDSGVYIMRGPD
jgi:hypothetical protein